MIGDGRTVAVGNSTFETDAVAVVVSAPSSLHTMADLGVEENDRQRSCDQGRAERVAQMQFALVDARADDDQRCKKMAGDCAVQNVRQAVPTQ